MVPVIQARVLLQKGDSVLCTQVPSTERSSAVGSKSHECRLVVGHLASLWSGPAPCDTRGAPPSRRVVRSWPRKLRIRARTMSIASLSSRSALHHHTLDGLHALRARDIGASATSWVAAMGPSGSVWDRNPFEGEGEVGRGNLDLDGVAPLAPDLLDRAHPIVETSQMG